METQPAPIGPRNLLGLSKESDEEQQHQVSIDARLELEVPGKIFRGNLALAFLELQRGVERVIYFLHERNQRPDIAVAQTRARIVPLQLLDQPARIVNPDVKLIVRAAQKGASQLAQFPRGRAGQARQLRAAFLVDQAILQIDPDLCVGSLKELLDLTEERFVHRKSEVLTSSSRLIN